LLDIRGYRHNERNLALQTEIHDRLEGGLLGHGRIQGYPNSVDLIIQRLNSRREIVLGHGAYFQAKSKLFRGFLGFAPNILVLSRKQYSHAPRFDSFQGDLPLPFDRNGHGHAVDVIAAKTDLARVQYAAVKQRCCWKSVARFLGRAGAQRDDQPRRRLAYLAVGFRARP